MSFSVFATSFANTIDDNSNIQESEECCFVCPNELNDNTVILKIRDLNASEMIPDNDLSVQYCDQIIIDKTDMQNNVVFVICEKANAQRSCTGTGTECCTAELH